MSSKFFNKTSLIVAAIAIGFASCGGSSSSNTTSTSGVSDLTQVPDITDIVSSSEASASLARFTVTGTPPNLVDITSEMADDLFFNGVVADINNDVAITREIISDFYNGWGACQMAQMTGYSFQNISQAGTTICYMKNVPNVTSGVSIESGSSSVEDALSQSTNTKIIKINIENAPEGGESQEGNSNSFYIKIYGSSTTEGQEGFAVDNWDCGDGDTPLGYEQIRVNNSSLTMTQTSYFTDWGTFALEFTGKLKNENGEISFDPDQSQSAVVTFGSEWGNNKTLVSILSGSMSNKNWSSWSGEGHTNENMMYIETEYSGDSVSNLKFLSAGFAGKFISDFGTDQFDGQVDYSSDHYAAVESGDLFSLVNDYDFTADDFFTGSTEVDSSLADALNDYSCSPTVDVVMSIDFSSTSFQEQAASLCENHFENMDFCQSEDIMNANNRIMQSDHFGEGNDDL